MFGAWSFFLFLAGALIHLVRSTAFSLLCQSRKRVPRTGYFSREVGSNRCRGDIPGRRMTVLVENKYRLIEVMQEY